MPPPSSITSWVSRTFPKPTVDPEWLDACYDWITTSLHPPDTHPSLSQIHDAVSSQLLQSNLSDSMLPGTGLPQNVSTLDSTRLPTSPGILVEITAITDIGVSAFSLLNARNMRKETEELVGIYEDDGDEIAREEIEQREMKYPRSMLRFELSDGCITLQALEYRKIDQLELGETPLGYKVSFISCL
jgi:RecQ-mediated genome instability protein 1